MDTSREARQLADELERTGLELADEAGAGLLARAAEIQNAQLGDRQRASAVLRQALRRFPGHQALLGQALQLAVEAGDHAEHAELLGQAVKAAQGAEQRARLLAKRGDVVGLGLGRVAEARGLYREAARLTETTELKSALEAVLLKIELHLEARSSSAPGLPVWAPVLPGVIALEAPAPVPSQPPDTLEGYQRRLQAEPEVDPVVLRAAIHFALGAGVVGIASRLLPDHPFEIRVELLEQLATGADGVGDEASALELWVVALEDSPIARAYEDELEDRLADAGRPRLYARYLRARARHSDDFAEKKRLLGQAQRKAEAAADLIGAAEAVLESLRLPGHGEDVERLLATADRLSLEARDRTILTRALGAAASHQELSPERRSGLLEELARILEVELSDGESAQAVRSELSVRPEPGPKDTAVDQPNPLRGMSVSARPWAEEYATPLPLLDEESAPPGPGEDEPLHPEVESEPSLTQPPTRRLEAPPLPGPSAIRHALRHGDLEGALRDLSTQPEAPVALWLGAGRLALALQQVDQAQAAFDAALLAASGEARREALMGAEQVARRRGATKEVARLLAERVESFEDRADHPGGKVGRQRALLSVAEAYVRARQRSEARRWLLRALELEPTVEALGAWLRLAADDGDPAEIERVWSHVQLERYPPAARAELLVARAGALMGQGDSGSAISLYQQALERDPQAIRPAEELLAIGIGSGQDGVIDQALEALRARLLGVDPTRAFLAAACRVARGQAPEAERQTYELGRLALNLRPTTALSKGWVGEWLGLFRAGGEVVLPPAQVGPELELSPAERQAVSDVEVAFGLVGTVVHPGSGGGVELLDRTPPRVGVPPALRGRVRRLRFELGRALAAVVEPQLIRPLLEPSGPGVAPDLGELVLDRAGLVVGGDPAVALEAVGPHSPRGIRLLAFATSRGLAELWGRLGVKVTLMPALTKPRFVT
ncbi:MAG: hypothetical protein IPG45_10205 [Deltaproteobacteria bacterium]|nr:hypothetical protein [Deltaproteobacteria bacterium]